MVISYAKIFMKNWRSYETTVPNPECLRDFGITVFDVELRRNEKYYVVSKKNLLKSGTQEIRFFYL
jgi:hypothetical protein